MKNIALPGKPAPAAPKINTGKIGASYGIGEMVECMNPLSFDLACIQKNIEYMLTKGIGTIGLSCDLGPPMISSVGKKEKIKGNIVIELPSYYEGECTSLFGYGSVQACDAFDAPAKAAQICTTKCASAGKPYISSGCTGSKIWCTCGGGSLI